MSWPNVALAEVGEISTGSTPKTSDARLWGGDTPFVTPSELGNSEPITAAQRYLSGEGVSFSRLAPEGAVLVCCIGSLGKTGIAGRPVVTNQQINWINFNKKIVFPRYGYYACARLGQSLDRYSGTTTIPIINKSRFSDLQIPLPPLTEQRRIAGILDKADALRRKRKRALELLDGLRQSIFTNMFGDPEANPHNYPTDELGNVAAFFSGNSLPAGDIYRDQPGGFLLLKVSDLNLSGNEEIIHSATTWRSEPGTKAGTCCSQAVVFPKRGGAIATNKKRKLTRAAILDPNLMAVAPDQRRLLLDYAYAWFQHFQLETISSGSSVPQINKQDLVPLRICMPPIELQKRFSERCNAVSASVAKMRTSDIVAESLFVSLQRRAFSGVL